MFQDPSCDEDAGGGRVFEGRSKLATLVEPNGMHLPDGISAVGTKGPKRTQEVSTCSQFTFVSIIPNSWYYTSFELIRRVLLRCLVIRLVDFFERLARRHAGTAASRRGHTHEVRNGRCYPCNIIVLSLKMFTSFWFLNVSSCSINFLRWISHPLWNDMIGAEALLTPIEPSILHGCPTQVGPWIDYLTIWCLMHSTGRCPHFPKGVVQIKDEKGWKGGTY